MKDKIQEVLNEIRVALQQDGGDIELLGVDENTGVVRVELQGRCRGCPYSQMTLTGYVEKVLKERIPEVTEVLNVNLESMKTS
ncbi:MAG: NifU family protein [Candidatus Heimdallarchaeota archaeon]|nr:NifU family protein [Candidatus Heimdallarchaeota archaeon]